MTLKQNNCTEKIFTKTIHLVVLKFSLIGRWTLVDLWVVQGGSAAGFEYA